MVLQTFASLKLSNYNFIFVTKLFMVREHGSLNKESCKLQLTFNDLSTNNKHLFYFFAVITTGQYWHCVLQ